MTEIVTTSDIMAIATTRKPLSRSEFARRGADLKKIRIMQELASDKNKVMVYSPLTSPDDLIPIISEEKETCMKIALRYAQGDQDAAEDIYQKALINAYQSLKGGEPYCVPRKAVKRLQQDDDQKINSTVHKVTVKNPAAWLHTIVRNTGLNECVSQKRTNALLKKINEDFERESRRFEQTEVIVLRNISNEELHYYVKCLPGGFSKIIDLHYFGGYCYEEIAKELGCPSSTVRGYAKRALEMLNDVYQNKRDVKGGSIGRPKKAG